MAAGSCRDTGTEGCHVDSRSGVAAATAALRSGCTASAVQRESPTGSIMLVTEADSKRY